MSLKRLLLTEISSDISNHYDYEVTKDEDDKKEYKFDTDNGAEYVMHATHVKDKIWTTGFTSEGWESNVGQRTGESTIKVLNTIFQIVKDFYDDNKNEVEGFTVVTTDDKRERVYAYYIKKLFPNVRIEDSNNPHVILYKV